MARSHKSEIRSTRATRRVLPLLLTGAVNLDGGTLMRLAGLTSPGAYSVVSRLADAGWIVGELDYPAPLSGTPRRRYYRLTPEGRAKAIRLLKLEMPDGEH